MFRTTGAVRRHTKLHTQIPEDLRTALNIVTSGDRRIQDVLTEALEAYFPADLLEAIRSEPAGKIIPPDIVYTHSLKDTS